MASFFAGHSSGEYAAACASGSLSFADAVRLTVRACTSFAFNATPYVGARRAHAQRLHGLLSSRTINTSSLRPSTDKNAPPERRAQMSALILEASHTANEVAEVVADVRQQRKGGEAMVEIASVNSVRSLSFIPCLPARTLMSARWGGEQSSQVILSGSRAGCARFLLFTRR